MLVYLFNVHIQTHVIEPVLADFKNILKVKVPFTGTLTVDR